MVNILTLPDKHIDILLYGHYNIVMPFIRAKKNKNGRTYYYLVENHREGKKVRQKVLKYLGTTKPSDQEIARLIVEIKKGE